jgi:hypothetical protein
MDIRTQIVAAEARKIHEETVLCQMAAQIASGLVIGLKNDPGRTAEEEMDQLAAVAADLASRIRAKVKEGSTLSKRNGG